MQVPDSALPVRQVRDRDKRMQATKSDDRCIVRSMNMMVRGTAYGDGCSSGCLGEETSSPSSQEAQPGNWESVGETSESLSNS
jgi:hypothetical protein